MKVGLDMDTGIAVVQEGSLCSWSTSIPVSHILLVLPASPPPYWGEVGGQERHVGSVTIICHG